MIAEILGRFHPLIVHLPIGIVVLAFVMELLGRRPAFTYLKDTVGFVLMVGFISALFAVITGWIMPKAGDFDAQLIRLHFWSALAFALVLLGVIFLFRSKHRLYFPTFCFALLLLLGTGHYGGSLTHGSNHLTEALNKPQAAKPIAEMRLYADLIQPILKRKCYSCHNLEKQKGGLLMSTIEGLMQGGENGPIILPQDAANSPLIQRIQLPLAEEEHMPPEGKVQITRDELQLLEWWINEGADFEQKVNDVQQPDPIKSILDKLEAKAFSGLKPISKKSIDKLRKADISISPLKEGSPFVSINLSRDTQLTASKLKALKSIAPNIRSLNLSFSNISDPMLAHLSGLKNLESLQLQQTQVSAKGIRHLEKLQNLRVLNLYATLVDDDVFQSFGKMKGLQTVYLWQSKVQAEQVKTFKKDFPDVAIHFEPDLSIFGDGALSPPQIISSKQLFEDTLEVQFRKTFNSSEIYYTLDGQQPDSSATLYTQPFFIDQTTQVKAIAAQEGWENSEVVDQVFIKAGVSFQSIQLSQPPHESYPGKGAQTLHDSRLGTVDFRDGNWLGYYGENLSASIDLGEPKSIKNLVVQSLEDTRSYIFHPKNIQILGSKNGKDYQLIESLTIPVSPEMHAAELKFFLLEFAPIEIQHLRIEIEGTLKNPDWHPAPGEKSWIFIGELGIG